MKKEIIDPKKVKLTKLKNEIDELIDEIYETKNILYNLMKEEEIKEIETSDFILNSEERLLKINNKEVD